MSSHSAPVPEGAPVTRRSLVDLLLGGSFVAWIGAVVYPVLRYLTPAKRGVAADKATLTDAQKGDLAAKGFLILPMGSERVLVLRDREQKLRALSAKCTHEGCTVQYVPADEVIWCACHNGKFALDGRVLSGPPPRALAGFTVEGDATGPVTIKKTGAA